MFSFHDTSECRTKFWRLTVSAIRKIHGVHGIHRYRIFLKLCDINIELINIDIKLISNCSIGQNMIKQLDLLHYLKCISSVQRKNHCPKAYSTTNSKSYKIIFRNVNNSVWFVNGSVSWTDCRVISYIQFSKQLFSRLIADK